MGYWHNVQIASDLGAALPWVVLIFLLAAVLTAAFAPHARTLVRAAVLMLAISFAGFLLAGALLPHGPAGGGAIYRWVRAISIVLQSVAIVTLAGAIFFDVLLAAVRMEPPAIVRDLILAFAYIGVGLLLLSHGGVNIAGVVATSAVITAVIGFSLQDTLGNVIGGVALQFDRTVGPGDWIKIEQTVGMVKAIRWRQTTIETRNWDTVVIPNSVLMKSEVTVLGRRGHHQHRQHRQAVPFNVDYRYPPTNVIDAVEEALRDEPIPGMASDPPPHCVMTDYKDSYAGYAVRYWLTDLLRDEQTDSAVRTRIYFALKRAGITPAIPAYAAFQTNEDPDRARSKRDQETKRRLEAISRVELFKPLTEEECQELAQQLKPMPFSRGEAMTRQGAEAHCFFILTRGDAEVRISENGTAGTRVATLHAGDFFGEMGLMTGSPRSATVAALTDAECYRLDKQPFHEILRRRPEIAEEVSQILARRRVELDAARDHLSEEAKRSKLQNAQGDLLKRIRQFFAV